jgi:prephenate dehydrogenase
MGRDVDEPILIVGYGRFGRAVGGLLHEAGRRVWALDTAASVPTDLQPPPDLLDSSAVILLSVPVLAVKDALEALSPSLGPHHLVVDVSSVRGPVEEALRLVLGDHVPWVGTHPLFGPSSIAIGERPLRVVICPNELHPEAAARAASLYASIGCEVIEEDAIAHDRSMAYSHALAFFLAKGMLDIDAAARTRFVPPSFQAMLQTIEAVRSDAGHLFYAIEALNPFSGEARSELLAALSRLDDELAQASLQPISGPEMFEIPDLGDAAPELRETRDLIDDVDRELVRLVARRSELAARAGRVKGERELPVRDAARERALLQERRTWAESEGLEPDAVARLFEQLMALARGVQERVE